MNVSIEYFLKGGGITDPQSVTDSGEPKMGSLFNPVWRLRNIVTVVDRKTALD